MTTTHAKPTPEDVNAALSTLNGRMRGVLVTGASDGAGKGQIVGQRVTVNALRRRGLVDAADEWTALGYAVAAAIDPKSVRTQTDPAGAVAEPAPMTPGTVALADDVPGVEAVLTGDAIGRVVVGTSVGIEQPNRQRDRAGIRFVEPFRCAGKEWMKSGSWYSLKRADGTAGATTNLITVYVLREPDSPAATTTAKEAPMTDNRADAIREELAGLDDDDSATATDRRDALIGELTALGVPRYPAGSPEHDAYRAELTTELAKFAGREAPYDVEPEPRPGAARLVGLETSDVPAVVEHLTTDRETVAAGFAPVVDQLADAADPESKARAELAKLEDRNRMRRSADLIAIDLLPHLAETIAHVRGEQPTAEGRAALDQLADALSSWVPGMVEMVDFEWRKLEEIDEDSDGTCPVCGVELPGISAHDVVKHNEHSAAVRHEARMAKLRTDRPELFADKPADGPDHSPGAANTLPDVECADPKHCPLIDGDGETVPVPECFVGDLNAARLFYAGRVKVPCGHYTSKSERAAGFKTCERC